MAKEKSIVEEAILQMKNLEEAVAENAKGILASTMKEEIKELVKESLNEQDEEEFDTEVDMEEPEMDEPDMDDMGDEDMEDEMDTDTPIDLTNKSNDEVLRVFQLMGPDDHIIVTKDDGGNINLKDTDTDKEYMIVGEGEEEEGWSMEEDSMDEEFYEMDGMPEDMGGMMDEDDTDFMGDAEMGEGESIEDIVGKVFDDGGYDEDEEEEEFESGDDFIYEIEMDEESEEESESEEPIYEIHFDDEEDMDYEEEEDMDDEEEIDFESMMESKKTIKPKGMGMGKPSKFKYSKSPNQGEGFKVVKKKADKTMGTGSAKKGFSYDSKGENLDGEFKIKPKVKKAETKEASRTLGSGSDFRKGGLPKHRAHSKANMNIEEGRNAGELNILREKNEEYRKALNVFRNKLNEVAIFNSNLAYATRLFTEHSTSKQEKINILRRFDGVETLKESKNLYKQIKDELTGTQSQPITESFEKVIEKVPSTGSAVNLIESKTYENPQFLRMKDLMTKLK